MMAGRSLRPHPHPLHAPAQHLVDIHLLPEIPSITILGTVCRCHEVHNLLIFKIGWLPRSRKLRKGGEREVRWPCICLLRGSKTPGLYNCPGSHMVKDSGTCGSGGSLVLKFMPLPVSLGEDPSQA